MAPQYKREKGEIAIAGQRRAINAQLDISQH